MKRQHKHEGQHLKRGSPSAATGARALGGRGMWRAQGWSAAEALRTQPQQHGCAAAVLPNRPQPPGASRSDAPQTRHPLNYVRTVIAPAWRGADGLARGLRKAMHLPEGPQAHNAHYANARRKERATGGQRVCVMRRYVKCMAASRVTGREQNARPSTARRSSPGGKRSAQGAGMCRGAQRAASAAGAKRSPEQPGAAQRQPYWGKT